MNKVPREERVLVFAPIGEDAALTCRFLDQAGFQSQACEDPDILCRALREGAGAVILAAEALSMADLEQLIRHLDREPSWSALPVLVLTGARVSAPAALEVLRALEARRGVVFLERPVRVMSLVSSVQAALEARRRQYQIRDLLHKAEEGIRYRDEFLAMLGHELRNPLAPIRNALDLLRIAGTEDAAKVQWSLKVIDRQVRQLTHLVDDLLDVARVTRGRIQLRLERVDPAETAAAAAEAVRPLLEQRRHSLILTLPEQPVAVQADSTRLAQVIINLLNNAAKYTEPDGKIWLTVNGDDTETMISVRDTGMGIPQELLPHIFEPFTQAGRSLARSQGGLGLGLTLVKRLVEMHSGRIEAFSEGLNRGSEFIVHLPVLPNGTQETTVAVTEGV